MKTLVLMLGMVGALTVVADRLSAAQATPEEARQQEYSRFAGTWKFVSIEVEGTPMMEKLFQNSRLLCQGDQFTLQEGNVTYRGTFQLDLSTKPKQIDVTFTEGPEKGKTSRGIYELEGDTYKVCIGLVGKDRPTAFVSKPGSGHVLEVLKREPGPAQEAVQKELAKLQGTWQLVSSETDGKQVPENQVKKIRVVMQGNRHTVYLGDQVLAKEVRFTINPTAKPKMVEDTLPDGSVIRGIYELDGDTLRSCVAAPGKERPTEFASRPGSGHTLRVFQREKAK